MHLSHSPKQEKLVSGSKLLFLILTTLILTWACSENDNSTKNITGEGRTVGEESYAVKLERGMILFQAKPTAGILPQKAAWTHEIYEQEGAISRLSIIHDVLLKQMEALCTYDKEVNALTKSCALLAPIMENMNGGILLTGEDLNAYYDRLVKLAELADSFILEAGALSIQNSNSNAFHPASHMEELDKIIIRMNSEKDFVEAVVTVDNEAEIKDRILAYTQSLNASARIDSKKSWLGAHWLMDWNHQNKTVEMDSETKVTYPNAFLGYVLPSSETHLYIMTSGIFLAGVCPAFNEVFEETNPSKENQAFLVTEEKHQSLTALCGVENVPNLYYNQPAVPLSNQDIKLHTIGYYGSNEQKIVRSYVILSIEKSALQAESKNLFPIHLLGKDVAKADTLHQTQLQYFAPRNKKKEIRFDENGIDQTYSLPYGKLFVAGEYQVALDNFLVATDQGFEVDIDLDGAGLLLYKAVQPTDNPNAILQGLIFDPTIKNVHAFSFQIAPFDEEGDDVVLPSSLVRTQIKQLKDSTPETDSENQSIFKLLLTTATVNTESPDVETETDTEESNNNSNGNDNQSDTTKPEVQKTLTGETGKSQTDKSAVDTGNTTTPKSDKPSTSGTPTTTPDSTPDKPKETSDGKTPPTTEVQGAGTPDGSKYPSSLKPGTTQPAKPQVSDPSKRPGKAKPNPSTPRITSVAQGKRVPMKDSGCSIGSNANGSSLSLLLIFVGLLSLRLKTRKN